MSRKRRRWPVVSTAWRAELAELFEPFVNPAWKMPETIRVYHGKRHFTAVARFTREDGHPVTVTSRIARAQP